MPTIAQPSQAAKVLAVVAKGPVVAVVDRDLPPGGMGPCRTGPRGQESVNRRGTVALVAAARRRHRRTFAWLPLDRWRDDHPIGAEVAGEAESLLRSLGS